MVNPGWKTETAEAVSMSNTTGQGIVQTIRCQPKRLASFITLLNSPHPLKPHHKQSSITIWHHKNH
jgi:hypothetical protein